MVNNFLEWFEVDGCGRVSSTIDPKFFVDVGQRSQHSAIALVIGFNAVQMDIVEASLGVETAGLSLAEFRELYKMTHTREREAKLCEVVNNLKEKENECE